MLVENRFFQILGFGNKFAVFNVGLFGYLAYIYPPLLLLVIYRFYDDVNYSFQKIRLTFAYLLLFICLLILQALVFHVGEFGIFIKGLLEPYIHIFGLFLLVVLGIIFSLTIISSKMMNFFIQYLGGTLMMMRKSFTKTTKKIIEKCKNFYVDLRLNYLQNLNKKILDFEYSEVVTMPKSRYTFHEDLIEPPLDEKQMGEDNTTEHHSFNIQMDQYAIRQAEILPNNIQTQEQHTQSHLVQTNNFNMPQNQNIQKNDVRDFDTDSVNNISELSKIKQENTIYTQSLDDKDSIQNQTSIVFKQGNLKDQHTSHNFDYLHQDYVINTSYTPRTQLPNTEEDVLQKFQKPNTHITTNMPGKPNLINIKKTNKEESPAIRLKNIQEITPQNQVLQRFIKPQNAIKEQWFIHHKAQEEIQSKTTNTNSVDNENLHIVLKKNYSPQSNVINVKQENSDLHQIIAETLHNTHANSSTLRTNTEQERESGIRIKNTARHTTKSPLSVSNDYNYNRVGQNLESKNLAITKNIESENGNIRLKTTIKNTSNNTLTESLSSTTQDHQYKNNDKASEYVSKSIESDIQQSKNKEVTHKRDFLKDESISANMPLHSTYKPFDMSFTQDSSAKKISLSHNSEVAPNDTLEMNLDCGKNSIKDSQIIEDNSSTLHELSSTKKQPESTYDRQETQHTQQVLQDNLKTQDVPMEETTEEITLEIPAFPAHLLGNYATLFGISDNSTHRNTIKSDNNQTIHDKKEYIKSHIYSDTESFLAVPTQDHIEKKIEITEITQSNLATQGTTSPTIVDNTHVNGIERSQAIQSNSNNSFVEANNLTPTKSFIARGLQDTMETNHHQPFPQDTMINDLKEKDSYIHLQETSQPSTQTNLHINLQMNPSTNTMQEYESTQDVKISEPKSLQPKAEVYNHDLKQYEQNNRLESPLQNNKVESVPYNLDSTHSNQTKANYHDMIRTQEKGYNVQQIQIKEQPDFIESTYSQNVLSQGKALSDTTSVQQRSKDSEIMQTQSSSMQNLQQDSHISYDEIPTSRLKTQNATTHQYPSEIQQDSNLQNIIPYTLPPASLLSVPKFHENIDDQEIDSKIENLLAKLRVFKIKGDIVSVFTGPVVTTFEFRPEADVKVNKVLGLQDDLAMALKAKSIRIQAPIPGKDVMGIEIPNNNVATIYLREILESQAFLQANDSLSIVLGKDIMGQPVVQNLAKLPHLLVAGTTGSGKSVGVNAIILSLLYRNSPDELKLMMIDPKKVEFAPYEDLPHLITPIINAPDKAIQALQAAAIEMDKRYEILSEHKVKTILSYNEKVEQKMPFFVIIIDELADLMMTGGKDAEAPIARIAQMGRAAGVHLIIATQRSSTNVVTGTIKANLPSRISYRVGNRVDSKVILDASGAERLLGNGDGLFSSPNGLQRIHAPWVSEREIEEIIDFIKSQREPQYDENFLSDNKSGVDLGDKFVGDGGILDEAKAVMLRDNKTSISNLQRKLGIGYNKAANIVEQLELEGFLSAPNNKGERTIMG